MPGVCAARVSTSVYHLHIGPSPVLQALEEHLDGGKARTALNCLLKLGRLGVHVRDGATIYRML